VSGANHSSLFAARRVGDDDFRVAWKDLAKEIAEEFGEAQEPVRVRLQSTKWRSHSDSRPKARADEELLALAAAELKGRPIPAPETGVSNTNAVPMQLPCKRCGALMWRKKWAHRYCDSCSKRPDPTIRKCVVCQKPFRPRTKRHMKCSRRCRAGYAPLSYRRCGVCSTEFMPKLGFEKYCGPGCNQTAKIRRLKQRIDAARPLIACEWCGKPFTKFHKRRLCSNACRKAWVRTKARRNYARRMARIRDGQA
jgi:hypothetical protein